MRVHQYTSLAAFLAVAATGAAAQTPSPAAAQATPIVSATNPNQWFASAFVGSNYGATAESSSVDFCGAVGYLWNRMVGGELLASFAPSFHLTNALLASAPNVNTYMANVIAAVPLGSDGQWQPFVSGGLGAVQLRSDMFNVANSPAAGSVSANDAKFGGDVGFGIMGYAANVGLRADVRYFRTRSSTNANPASTADAFASNLLSGLDFWRANIGVAVRW